MRFHSHPAILGSLVIVAGICFIAYAVLSGEAALAPEDASARSFDRASIAEGAQLALLGNCNTCHTAIDGASYAGGRALPTPLGTLYGTNITPDPDTGIGRWSYAAFSRAMREGIGRDGRHLYPAFPYDHFTRLADDDIRALYAFLMTREPVRAEEPENDLVFPLNLRPLIGAWKLLFFERGSFQSNPDESAQWNRGAYLVEGLAHCGSCHTKRNLLGAEDKHSQLAGGETEGWHAPALDRSSPAPAPWTVDALDEYLRTGLSERHAIAAGPMSSVVRNLAAAPSSDVKAIATYIAAAMGQPTQDRSRRAAEAVTQVQSETIQYPLVERTEPTVQRNDAARQQRGAVLYAGLCATCHDQGRRASSGAALHLALGSATTLPSSANLIRIILEGIPPEDGAAGRLMPGFADVLTDEQVVDLVAYVRSEFGRAHAWSDIETRLQEARESHDQT